MNNGFNNCKYDNAIWKDINGTVRNIKNMDTMHLIFIMKQLEVTSNRGIKNRMAIIKKELQARINQGFTLEDFHCFCSDIINGVYIFYKEERTDSELKLLNYYSNLIRSYPYFTPPYGLFE